jgi:hypothetical protein
MNGRVNCCLSSPAQSFLVPSPENSRPYFTVSRLLESSLSRPDWRLTDGWIEAGPRQHSDFWFRVQRDSWPYFTVWGFWEPSDHPQLTIWSGLVNCCCPSPTEWFLIRSSTGLMIVFYVSRLWESCNRSVSTTTPASNGSSIIACLFVT